jgi:O-antigen/teichoic acid export membrane protein
MKITIIDRLSKLFRTDVHYIVKGGFWLTVAKVLSTLASLISSVAFANLLPEETYGVFRYVLSIAMILAIPTLHGIETALARSVAKGCEADFEKALQTRLRFGSLGALASAAVALYYWFAGDNTLALSFLIVTVFVPFMDSFHLYAALLNGQKKFQALARDEVATRMTVALLLALVVFFTDNIFTAFLLNSALFF